MRVDPESQCYLWKLFQYLDSDGNGTLTDNDFTPQFHGRETRAQTMWYQLRSELDHDLNGEISYDEFANGMGKQAINCLPAAKVSAEFH